MVRHRDPGQVPTVSGKQMEGDNQRRRALARQAREDGMAPSEAGVTLGAGKQREHEQHARREGPPPPSGLREGGPPPPAPEWPRHRPPEERAETGIQYRELVSAVGGRTGLGFEPARLACEATVTVVARALDAEPREQFLRAVPAELHDDYPVDVPDDPGDLAGFLGQVAAIVQRTPDQARYQAQAVLSAM